VEQALRDVLSAAASAPYYADAWNASQKRAAKEGRLQELPLVTKEAIRCNPHALLRRDVALPRLLRFHTSGSTGTPLVCLTTVEELRVSMAIREARSAGWAGVSFREPRATFSGRMVEPDPSSAGPYYRYNLAEGQVYLSAFHLGPKTAPAYMAALARHRVRWLTGYAVSLSLLARYALELSIAPPPLAAVITTSEKLTPEMRERMRAAFRCPVFEEYSNVENSLFASECERGSLHVSPDAGIVEILRPDGSACDPGEPGEVVTTSLLRRAQPFVRYRLGDIAVADAKPCACGREMPVLREVVGRLEDVVTTPDGRQLVRFHGIFVDQPHVREGQVVQEAGDRFAVRVVPAPGFGPADVADIVARMQQRLGAGVAVSVETVDSIPRTAAGKFRAVVSRLPEAEHTGGEAPA
jgi:phenylacetate-CoA ligase